MAASPNAQDAPRYTGYEATLAGRLGRAFVAANYTSPEEGRWASHVGMGLLAEAALVLATRFPRELAARRFRPRATAPTFDAYDDDVDALRRELPTYRPTSAEVPPLLGAAEIRALHTACLAVNTTTNALAQALCSKLRAAGVFERSYLGNMRPLDDAERTSVLTAAGFAEQCVSAKDASAPSSVNRHLEPQLESASLRVSEQTALQIEQFVERALEAFCTQRHGYVVPQPPPNATPQQRLFFHAPNVYSVSPIRTDLCIFSHVYARQDELTLATHVPAELAALTAALRTLDAETQWCAARLVEALVRTEPGDFVERLREHIERSRPRKRDPRAAMPLDRQPETALWRARTLLLGGP